jgi:hypothetical protein
MSNDPETRPSQGNDVHQDQHGKYPAPAPDNARSSDRLTKSEKESGKAVYGADKKKSGRLITSWSTRAPVKSLTPYSVSADFSASARTSSPVPWKVLRYDSNIDSYHSDISENRLKGAPKHGTETIFDWNARYAELDDYYNDEVVRPG